MNKLSIKHYELCIKICTFAPAFRVIAGRSH